MLSDDAFEWFKQHGGLDRKNGDIFRDKILSRGNSIELGDLYRQFRGQNPSVQPLLDNRGLK